MKLKHLFLLLWVLALTLSLQAAEKALFITGGQSNTDGRLYAATLPTYLQTANSNCLASFHSPYSAGRLGEFYAYFPTSGTTGQPSRWAYDAVTYHYIGEALQETFYVAKTSYGGTSIDPSISNSPSAHDNAWLNGYGSGYHWSADPTFLGATTIAGTTFEQGGTTYDGQSMLLACMANVDAAIDAITTAGDTPDIKAIIWHQGESDKNAAGSYYNNLKAMVAYVRNHIEEKTGDSKYSTLPFFCGTIPHASSLCNSTVEKAFFTLEDEDANFHVIDLRDLTMLSDAKHFDAPSAELFGKRLYNRMVDEGVISGTRLDDVEYAQIDYSDFDTDEYVGETKTWTFESFSGQLQTTTTCFDALYLHSNNMNGRAYVSSSTEVGSVTFADGTVQSVSKTLGPKTGANKWTAADVATEANASRNFQVAVAVNVLYPGRFSMMISAPDATAESPKTYQLILNGTVVAEQTFTSGSEMKELYYDAEQAGTFFMHPDDKFNMYAVRYVPATDRTAQRTVTTDADGYAAFGNLSGANLGLPAGLTAWAVAPSTSNVQQVELLQMGGVDKGTAAILIGEANTEYVLPFAWSAVNYEGENDMTVQQQTGDVEETSGGDFVNYIFANEQFTKVSTPVSVEAGKAYLSISNGLPQCSYATLTFDDPNPAVSYDFIDSYARFGSDEVVWAAKTWLSQDLGFPSSYSDLTTATGHKDGLYWTSGGSSNRSWKSANQGAGTYAFADGTTVKVTKTARSSGASPMPSVLSSHTASATLASDFAINAAVPGTFSLLRSGNSTGYLYFNGTKVAELTTTDDSDMKEIGYTATTAGTFVYVCTGTSNVAALRFVPTDKKAVYTQVTPIGWATVSLLYPAVVPDGTCAYYVSDYQDDEETGTLTLTKVEAGDIIPAREGFLFNAPKGLHRFEKSASDDSWDDNLLTGTADAALTGYNSSSATNPIYVLATIDANAVGFKRFSGTSIAQYKAYLQLGVQPAAHSFCFIFDDDPTEIDDALCLNNKDKINNSVEVYNLNGLRVQKPMKGLYIVRSAKGRLQGKNGKKVIY